jgi:hypothetical protein
MVNDRPQRPNRSRTNVLCIFCNQRRPRAIEDIISNWIAREFDPVGAITTDFITAMPGEAVTHRSQQFGNLATLKLKRVCEVCNTGWMSAIEDETRPILAPLIHGQPSQLSLDEQVQLTLWGQLKALSLDAYYLDTYQGIQHLPDRVFQEFEANRQPIEQSTVTLGRYLPPPNGVMLPWGRHLSSAPATEYTPPLDVLVATFGFGHLLLQISIGAWHGETEHAAYSLVTRVMPQCWPPRDDNLVWPPAFTATPANFDVVASPVVMVTPIESSSGAAGP